jgi:tetratricopeptide (TPR) repeat protein
MRCAKCSSVIPDGSRVCDSCGAILESSSLKLGDRLRAANPNASRRPSSSASNPGSLKIGARLRILSQQNQNDESLEENPFSFSKPKNSPSTAQSGKAPVTAISEESPFLPKSPQRAPTPSPLFSIPKDETPPINTEPVVAASPFEVASPFVSPSSPFEVVGASPFESPSSQNLAVIQPKASEEPEPLVAPIPVAEPVVEVVPESPKEAPAFVAEESPAPKVEVKPPLPPRVPVAESKPIEPGMLPPPLPPTEKKKDLRTLIKERTQTKDATPASTPDLSAPPKPSAGLFKPPPPLSPKPPPLIQAKPKAGLQAPPAPKPVGVAPPIAVKAPEQPIEQSVLESSLEHAPESVLEVAPEVLPVKEFVEPANESIEPNPIVTPVSAISESIEIDDFMAEIEEEVAQEQEPPPLEELEAISIEMDELSDKLDPIRPANEFPVVRPDSFPSSEPAKNAEEPDEFAIALQSLDVSSASLQNPFSKSASEPEASASLAPKEQISENTLLAISLDKAAGSVDDLFGNLVQPSNPSTPAVSAPPVMNAPQAAKSVSLEFDEVEVIEEKGSNPFADNEENFTVDAGSAVNSLAERAAIYRKSERWRELVEALKEIAARSQEPLRLWIEIGDLQWERLQDKEQSIASHQKALSFDNKNEKLIEKLLAHCFEAGQWEQSFELIERLGVMASGPAARARRFFDAALTLHQKYQQSEIALDLFNEALDIDAQLLESFEQIDRMLTKQRNWALLEQNYRRMVKRVPDSQRALLVMLWHNLGEIYRTRLGQMRQATEAFEEASRLDPTNPTRQKILAELYAADPAQWERTAEHERLLFATGVERERALHNLFRIYSKANQKDRAFRVAFILTSLGVSTQEEDAFYSHGLGVMPRVPSLPISDEQFKRLVSPKAEDSTLSTIFRLLAPYAAILYSRSEKDWGLHKKERLELSSTKYAFTRSLQMVLRQLHLSNPVLYVNTSPGPDEPPNTGLELEPLLLDKHFAPAVIAGTSATSPRRESDTIFLLARHLVYLRPEYLLIRLCRMNQGLLKILLRAAIYLVNQSIPLPKEEEEEILQISKRLSKEIPAATIAQIKLTVEEAIRGGNDFSTTRWMAQVEHAATRAAFVLCGDLDAATRILQSDTTPLSVLATKTKLYELQVYMLSDEYSVLREELNIAWPAGR